MLAVLIIFAIILLYLCTRYEKFTLADAKRELRRSYYSDAPFVQYTVNPVPDMIRTVDGESYYPVLPARRPNAIVNPITEPYLRNVMINNINNIAMMSTTNSKDESILNNNPYLGGNQEKIQAYAYPHSDLPTSQTYITGSPLYATNQYSI